jgi:hypothetical protein
MLSLGTLFRRLLVLVRHRRFERDLDEELAFHLAMREQEGEQNGAEAPQAPLVARRRFGSVALTKDRVRDVCTFAWVESVLQDVRFAVRTMRKRPGLALVMIATLALGMGATAAMFSVADRVLLRPLPFGDPRALVAIWERPALDAQWTRQTIPVRLFLEWRRHAQHFQAVVGFTGRDYTMLGPQGPERVHGDAVSADFFVTLGMRPALGSTLLPDDDAGAPVVVLSHRFWDDRFGGSEVALGQSLILDGVAHAIVGVLPAKTAPPFRERPPELWTVLRTNEADVQRAGRVAVVGRLRSGATRLAAEAELERLQEEWQRQQPGGQRTEGVMVRDLQDDQANVAGLLLGRALERSREIALRTALGASQGRVLRQLMVEHVVLWGLAGAAGLVVAKSGIRWLVAALPLGELPTEHIAIDGRAVVFTGALTLVTVLAFGFMAAARGARLDLAEALARRRGAWRVIELAHATVAERPGHGGSGTLRASAGRGGAPARELRPTQHAAIGFSAGWAPLVPDPRA